MNRFTYKKEDIPEGNKYVRKGIIPRRYTRKRDKERFKRKWSGFKLVKGDFYKDNKKLIFAEDVQDVIRHDIFDEPNIGLTGRDKLFYRAKQSYIGITKRAISYFLKNYETPQILKQTRKNVPQSRGHAPMRPLIKWYADLTFVTKPQNTILLTMIDQFSKYAWVEILPNKQASTIVKTLENIFKQERPNLPKFLHTDNGAEFVNKKVKALLRKYNIKHSYSRPHIAEDASFVERFNRTIKRLLNVYSVQWNNKYITDTIVRQLVDNYNSSLHSTIKTEPRIIHPNKYREPAKEELKRARGNIRKRTIKVSKNYKNIFKSNLSVGDKVRAKMDVLQGTVKKVFKEQFPRLWSFKLYEIISIGKETKSLNPYYIIKRVDLKRPNNRKWYRHELLKIDDEKLIRELGEDRFVVDKIIDKRIKNRRTVQYLVHFLHTPSSEDAWIDKTNLKAPKAIKDYEKKS